MEQEKERGITITSAAVTCFWTQKTAKPGEDKIYKAFNNVPHRVNIIDTPGTWTSPPRSNVPCACLTVRSPCSAVSLACNLSLKPSGVRPPNIMFAHRVREQMDRIGANFENALNDMRTKLRAYAFPVFLPLGQGPTEAEGKPVTGGFEGVIDVVNQKVIYWDRPKPMKVLIMRSGTSIRKIRNVPRPRLRN